MSSDTPSSSSTSGQSTSHSTHSKSKQGGIDKPFHAYKLIIDPCLVKGANAKLYRFDGIVQDDPTYPPVVVRDPRNQHSLSRLWKNEAIELKSPRFKIDAHYCGTPPPLQVTITNINDNIDKPFLSDLLLKYGVFEDIQIFFHPVTKKHLGLAHVLFLTKRGATCAIDKLNHTSVMGQVLNVFLDPFGKTCKSMYDDLTVDKRKIVEIDQHIEEIKMVPKKSTVKRVPDESVVKHTVSKHKISTDSTCSTVKSAAIDREQKDIGKEFVEIKQENCINYSSFSEAYYLPPLPPEVVQPTSFVSEYIPPNTVVTEPAAAMEEVPLETSEIPIPPEQPDQQVDTNIETVDQLVEDAAKGSPKMDLDTRIKMLLKGEHANEFGRLLGVCNDDDDGNNSGLNYLNRAKLGLNRNDIWNADPDSDDENSLESLFARKFKRNAFVPVETEDRTSSPPSPFLLENDSQEKPVNGLKLSSLDFDEISDDSALTPDIDGKRNLPDVEDTSLIMLPSEPPPDPPLPPEVVPEIPPLPEQPPPQPPPPPPPSYFPPAPPSYMQPAIHQQVFAQYNHAYSWGVDNYSMYPTYYESVNVVPNFGVQPPLPPDEVEEPVEVMEAKEVELTREEILEAVINDVFGELQQIVKRDFQRKLIESHAFSTFENWWTEQENLNKDSQATDRLKKLQPQGQGDWSDDASKSDIFGLGFRATIPKLPCFRKKRSVSSLHEDHLRSYDSENEDRETAKPRRRRRQRSLSSEASTSSLESSSELSDDSYESGSELETKLAKTKKIDLNLEILSDVSNSALSDSDKKVDEPLKSEMSTVTPTPTKSSPIVKEDFIPAVDPRPKSPEQIKKKRERKEITITGPLLADDAYLTDHSYAKPPEARPIIIPKIIEPVKPVAKSERGRKKLFALRTEDERRNQVTEFLREGIDQEDTALLKLCFEMMAADSSQGAWLSKARWVDHPITKIEQKMKSDERIHLTGSCRTEGYYKLTVEEKMRQKRQWFVSMAETKSLQATSIANSGSSRRANRDQVLSKTQLMCREARSNQRRLLTEFGTNESDLLKFNQLKFRKKGLRFARSRIHDWGLFAAEPIAADEMVIEYVGQMVRNVVADRREKVYENVGIMSSYLFKIDSDIIVDATKCGNLSRFINHSCNPNCYAKIISIEGEKRIVIYSKQQIAVDEEITYDYKFPFEDAKIKCLCGTSNCRGFLN